MLRSDSAVNRKQKKGGSDTDIFPARRGEYDSGMRHLAACVMVVLVGVGCASGPPPAAPSPPEQSERQAREEQQRKIAEASAAGAKLAQQDEAAAEAERTRQKDLMASVMKQAQVEAKADEEKRAADARQKRERACADAHPARVASSRKQAAETLRWVKAIWAHREWISRQCELVDTTGTHVSVQGAAGGVVVRTRQVGDANTVRCKSVRPRGVTDEDIVEYIRHSDLPDYFTKPFLASNCDGFYKPAGLDLSTVTRGDQAALQRVISMPDPSPAP